MNWGFQELDILVRTGDGLHVVIMEPITYCSRDGRIFSIEPYTKSDGASSPKIFWNLFPPCGKYWKAAIFHDWLYNYTLVPKKECDNLFLEAMDFLGVEEGTKDILTRAVMYGGQSSFDEARKKQKERIKNASNYI